VSLFTKVIRLSFVGVSLLTKAIRLRFVGVSLLTKAIRLNHVPVTSYQDNELGRVRATVLLS